MFALPIPEYHNPHSKRRSQYASKKRKRGQADIFLSSQEQDDNTSDEDASLQAAGNPRSSQVAEYSAVITPEERSEFRAAGQPFDQDPPQFPFPHRALGPRKGGVVEGQTGQRQVSPLRSVSGQPSRPPTLHREHLGVLMAIVHRSMLEKNYARARRVLGLILRDRIGGQGLDIRREGLWGIGAEVLLHQGARLNTGTGARGEMYKGGSMREPGKSAPDFTLKGFEDAKQYYERLIIQYPFNKNYASAVSALDFYPAMFGLWIYLVQRLTRQFLERRPAPEDPESADHVAILVPASGEEGEHSIGVWEVEQARALSERMDLCMSNIPFSDDAELIRLRGMVARWLADLLDQNTLRDQPSDVYSPRHERAMSEMAGELSGVSLSGSASGEGLIAARLESARSRRKAQEMFRKLERQGGDTA